MTDDCTQLIPQLCQERVCAASRKLLLLEKQYQGQEREAGGGKARQKVGLLAGGGRRGMKADGEQVTCLCTAVHIYKEEGLLITA